MSGIISLSDHRARRTRAAIVTAFNQLLSLKGYDDITPAEMAPKRRVSLRLDPDAIDHSRAAGRGWQSRIDDALRQRPVETLK